MQAYPFYCAVLFLYFADTEYSEFPYILILPKNYDFNKSLALHDINASGGPQLTHNFSIRPPQRYCKFGWR